MEAPPPVRGYGWKFSCVLLLLLALLQVSWFNRNLLVTYVPGAPYWLKRLCGKVPCHTVREDFMSQIHMLQRDVRSHPFKPNTLLVNTLFNSKASGVIRYPTLRLVLYDGAGQPLRIYEHTPGEYIADPIQERYGLRPGNPVHVLLELPAPNRK